MFGLGCLCRGFRTTMGRWAAWHDHELGHSPLALHVSLERESDGELSQEKRLVTSATRNDQLSPQQERIFCKQNMRMQLCITHRIVEVFKQDVHASRTGRGTRSARAICSRTVTCRSTGDCDSAPLMSVSLLCEGFFFFFGTQPEFFY